MLLNFSDNDCEPIVCTEAHVWNFLARTGRDVILIGSRSYAKVEATFAWRGELCTDSKP